MRSTSIVPLAAAFLHQERRSLRFVRGGRVIGTGNSGLYRSDGGETLSATQIIIIFVACATAVALLVLGCGFWNWVPRKKAHNPSWKFLDYFKRKNIPAAEKSEAMLHETRIHAKDAVMQVAHDNPRVNLGSKSRKQAAAPREP